MLAPIPKPASSGRAGARLLALAAATLAVGALLAAVTAAPAQDLQGRVDAKKRKLEEAQDERGVVSSEIRSLSNRIERLEGEVASLRNREARVHEELVAKQAELEREQHRLAVLRKRLRRAIEVLEERLVAIYKSDNPSVINVVLDSEGFDDLLGRSEYLSRIEDQDSDLVAEVRELRNQTRETVERVRAARDAIAAKERELRQTRIELQGREQSLAAARSEQQGTLSRIDTHIERLEGDIGDLEGQIQAQLAAAASEQADSGSVPEELPAGPVQEGSGGMIWPVNGTVSSGFGMRWGRLHAGVDIAVPAGTPIRAAKAGSIALAAPTGGYGNYMCINHGGGLSTCYAHLSGYATTSGSVGQGDVIGYVGCTGSCFGDHLHFEVRLNGSPVDPLGYL